MSRLSLLAASGFHAEDAILIVVIAVLLAGSGVLAMAETSLVRMNRIKAKSLVDEKKRGARQLARRDLGEEEKRWWQHQRAYGLCQAVRLASEQEELSYIADRLETPGGIRALRRIIRNSFPKEYRAAS